MTSNPLVEFESFHVDLDMDSLHGTNKLSFARIAARVSFPLTGDRHDQSASTD